MLDRPANNAEQYFLGAQVDVSGLVRECPGLEAHKRALNLNQEPLVEPQTPQQVAESIPTRQSSRQTNQMINGTKYTAGHDRVGYRLRAFLERLSADEVAFLRLRDRSQSPSSPADAETPHANRNMPYKSVRLERQYLSDESPVLVDAHEAATEDTFKPLTSLAGSLPGVYHNYLLVRPDPSLHILFASSALQNRADLRQTPLLSHISTSMNTLAGLHKAFGQGIPVTGRVVWKPAVKGVGINDAASGSHASWHSAAIGHGVEGLGQSQWLSATPLVGSDDRVGVWVVIILKAPYVSAVGETF